MPSLQFCTYFDVQYVLKGRALYRSLEEHVGAFELWVLCLDDITFDLLAVLDDPRIHPVRLAELELWEPRLPQARSDRSLVEYYWTCTPTWIAYILEKQLPGTWVSYLDADLFFYSRPDAVLSEAGDASIIIHEHRYAPRYAYQAATSGIYNVGWTGFRADSNGWAALHWWQLACLEACYLRPEAGLCGDQKYLDDWPQRFQGVYVLKNPGAGLAPWNIDNYHFDLCQGVLTVDTHPLIFYHFHAFQLASPRLMGQRGYDVPAVLRQYVYVPYARTLQESLAQVRQQRPGFRAGVQWPHNRAFLNDLRHGRYFWV